MSMQFKTTTRASVSSSGNEANGASLEAQFSPDSSKLLFQSTANNLITGDTNGASDIFLKDLTTGIVSRLSITAAGTQGNGSSFNAQFSANGAKVVFESTSDNLAAGDTNNARDIFLKDLGTGVVTRLSTDSAGNQGDGMSARAQLSANASKVVFESNATNLVSGDTNGTIDIFVKDIATGAVTRVNTTATGTQANAFASKAAISNDGTKVLFESGATNLVTGDTNDANDIFVKNLTTGAITRVSTSTSGGQGNAAAHGAHFSADGTKVIFSSDADNLVAGDNNFSSDVFVKDLATGVITRVSTNGAGVEANGYSADAQFSADGTKIVFASSASNLVTGDTNGYFDIFVKDLLTGEVVKVSKSTTGVQGNGNSFSPVISANGEKIAYESSAKNLVSGDGNNVEDIFVSSIQDDKVLNGGSGSDTLTGGSGNDLLIGGDGNDRLFGLGGNDTIYGGAGRDRLEGDDGNDLIYGEDGQDTLRGGNGNDTMYGGSGDDTMYGGDGDDYMDGGNSSDILQGEAGNDTLYGGSAEDSLRGGEGSDFGHGGSGADDLRMGNGNDTLNGGTGVDKLYGDAGADLFIFDADAFVGADRLKDFSLAQGDVIQLDHILNGYHAGDNIHNYLRLKPSSGIHQVLQVDQDGTGTAHGFVNLVTIEDTIGQFTLDSLFNAGGLHIV